MAQWQPSPLVGGAYRDDVRAFSVQDTVNYIPERAERPGGRAEWMLRDAPGAHAVCDLGTAAPIRGLHNCEGRLLAVSGTHLFNIAADYTPTILGTIPGVSRVSIDHNQITNGNEVLIANGASGYVYDTVAGTVAQITDVSYPGAIVVTYLDQVLAQIDPTRRMFFHSDLTQATQYLSTDTYEAESAPDLLVTLIASHGQLVVFGDRTADFYQATGGNSSFFERMDGTTLEVGCAATHAISRLDATVYWVGSDGCGYRLNGLSPQRITTHAIEQAWAKCDRKKAFSFTFEDLGHKVWYVTFPDGETWGFDVATEEWHRRQSAGLRRWRINALVYWNGQWIGGDFSNGKLYRLDWDYKLEGCEPLVRERISGVLHSNQNAVGVNAIELVYATGGMVSQPHDPPTVSGNLPNGTVGDVVSYQYAITRAYPGQVYTVTAEGLPDGLSISSTGLVTGVLTMGGVFTSIISATDECSAGTLVDSVSVLGLLGTLASGEVGVPYSSGLTAVGGTPPYVDWQITAGTLPAGLAISTTTGLITGTPT